MTWRDRVVELDVILQEKDLLREMIAEDGVEKIALWSDGEWSVYLTEHFMRRRTQEKPIHIIDVKAYFCETDFSDDSIGQLIECLEDILNEEQKII